MNVNLICPCGEQLVGSDEDDLVDKAQRHLVENHPDKNYTREEILFLSY